MRHLDLEGIEEHSSWLVWVLHGRLEVLEEPAI